MKPVITIVTPCYNEEENVRICYETIRDLFESSLSTYDFEYIFADNCSTDATVERLRELAAADPRVKVIVNSKNFGPMRSNFNALLSASGDAVLVSLAADFQDPPELIPEFVRKWEQGYEIVYGVRKNRQEGFLIRSARHMFYRIVNRVAEGGIPEDAGEFQLIDHAVLKALRGYEDYYPYIRGMIASCGFRSIGISYNWGKRRRGLSKATLYGMTDQAINAIISFSNVPIRVCLMAGLVISLLSVAYAVVILALVLFLKKSTPGVPTIAVALFFFGGVQLFFLGFLGEYITAIHFQVRKRPLVVERERINFGESAPPPSSRERAIIEGRP